METNEEQLKLLKEMLESKKEELKSITSEKEKEEIQEEIELLKNHIEDIECNDTEEDEKEDVEEIKQDENTKEIEVQNAPLEKDIDENTKDVNQDEEVKVQNAPLGGKEEIQVKGISKKSKKKYIIGVIVLIIIIILPFLGIFTINMSNQSTYKEVVVLADELGYSEVKLGYIHKKDEVNEAKEELTKEKSSVDLVNSATQQIKDTVNDTATNYLASIQKTSLDNILNNLTTNDDNTNIYYLNKVNSTTTQQYQYTSVIALTDDLTYITAQDNFKPAKSNKKIKSYVSDIDEKATKAYNEVLKTLGTNNTIEELKTFITSFDFTKALTDKDIERLKKYTGYLISPKVIEDVDSIRKDIKAIKDKINAEVKAVKTDKKEAEAKESSANSSNNSNTTNLTNSNSNSSSSNYNNSNNSNTSNNTNSGGGSTTDSCGWGTDCYCKQHYASEGWTVYYPDNDDCGYPNAGQNHDWATPYAEGYDREFSTAIFNAVNDVRSSRGLNKLTYDNSLQSCTDADAKGDKTNGPHSTYTCNAQGLANTTQIEAAPADIGERTQGVTNYANQIANGWANSPGHAAVMFREDLTSMCVSVYHNGNGSAMATVNFPV